MSIRHAVVIATTGTRNELLRRALESVFEQTLDPHRIVLVVDGQAHAFEQLRADWPRCSVLKNRRIDGASGAWNTAIDHLLRTEASPNQILVSFLDDDDYWESGYLREVGVAATHHDAEVVGATLVRHDSLTVEGKSSLVARLEVGDFLVGNPGLQQTNLSIRLDTLVAAGCFDEALASCTDRDLCIRLADLGARYATAPEAIGHHDTLHGLERLSDPRNSKKHDGLDVFFAKYDERMTAAQRAGFIERTRRLFQWTGPRSELPPRPRPGIERTDDVVESLSLVVGLIVDCSNPARAEPLIEQLVDLASHRLIESLDVVLLLNGSAQTLGEVTGRLAGSRIRAWPVDAVAQQRLGLELGLASTELAHPMTIAVARTLLHRFVHEVARACRPAAAWILDDDSRLVMTPEAFVAAIREARDRGLAVAIGSVVGAPPVPSSSTLRVQLVDLFHALASATSRLPSDCPPSTAANARWIKDRRDYYYDLARTETDRLETPFVPEHAGTTFAAAIPALANRACRILAGELVTRQIAVDTDATWTPTHLRGGNTVIFDLDLLRDVPNLSPRLEGRRVRRSDMIWALLADRSCGKLVSRAPIAVAQDRSMEPAAIEEPRKLVEDILGYAFFRAYEEVSTGDAESLRRRARKLASERLATYRLSFHRARGLVRAIRRLIASAPWWASREVCAALDVLLVGCDDALTDARLDAVVAGVAGGIERLEIEAFLAETARFLDAPAVGRLATWREPMREARARDLLRSAGIEADRLLGMGNEGVVLRAGDRAFKVFDGWSRDDERIHLETLRTLVTTPCAAFPQVFAVRVVAGTIVLETAYEPSAPYRGGCGPALFAMLRSLQVVGWTHTNLHPKNLRVTESGLVRVVDLGRSVISHTDAGQELMIRRAFLTWRFWFRSDLEGLMHRSLTSDDFVELVGWRVLLEGVRETSAKARLDARLEGLLAASDPVRVLDLGAGKPRKIHFQPRAWFAFDPEPELRSRWATDAPRVVYLDEAAMTAALAERLEVDAAVCSLVLCAVDDSAMMIALERMRAVLAEGGQAWVAVCDPTSIHAAVTADFERRSESAHYAAHATYSKVLRATETQRVEHHRPLAAYRRAFAVAGFAVERELTIDGIDATRFERVSEFRIFQLRVLRNLPCSTSLLIKVCGMDAATVVPSIEHLVRQLGRPRAFSEVVVVVDPRVSDFARAHHEGDLASVRAALSKLHDAGVIDRIIEGPSDGATARAISREWFSVDAERAHAHNGQPLLAIVDAIAQCRGDLVFHADIDGLIARPDEFADHIAAAHAVFGLERDAVALSLPVCGDSAPIVRDSDERGPFRVDAVCGWVHRARLLALRPLSNELRDGALVLPWHRAVDRAIRGGSARSLRCGGAGIWFAHPDNARKVDADRHLMLVDQIEAGHAAGTQHLRAGVSGSYASWCGEVRHERVVVVVTGRNVSAGRVRRGVDSLRDQTFGDWGAIVIDDASDNGSVELLDEVCRDLRGRMTLVRRRRRAGLLANLVLAVRHLVARADAIIVTFDLDDALASGALAQIVAEHDRGADLTVGSMVRTDKEITYEVDFRDPRGERGGNVWQHARSFRRSLFERIEERDLKVDGTYVDLATDWAFMLPLVEMAHAPAWIREPIYLHEPSVIRDANRRTQRESIIGAIVRKDSYRTRAAPPSVTVLAYHRITDDSSPAVDQYRSRGMVVSPANFHAHLRAASQYFEAVRLSDVERAYRDGVALPTRALLVTIDDGYADAARAVEIALELGFPVGLFARRPTADGLPTWAPLDLLYHAGQRRLDAAAREDMLAWPLSDQLGFAAAGVNRERAHAWRRDLYLSDSGLRALLGPDVELGIHGVDHVRWTNLGDDALRSELEASFAWSTTFEHGTRAIAYPDGCVDPRVARLVEQTGVSVGFAIGSHSGVASSRFSHRRAVARDDARWIESVISDLEVAS